MEYISNRVNTKIEFELTECEVDNEVKLFESEEWLRTKCIEELSNVNKPIMFRS